MDVSRTSGIIRNRSDSTLDHAQAVKARLISEGDAIDDPGALGDGLMLQNYYPQKDPVEIQKLFGSGFADSLVALSPRQWHGPVLSGYGTHLVYVHNVIEPPEPLFADTRERVTQDWTMDRGEELNEQFYASLKDQYTIVIEKPAVDDKVVVGEPSR